MKEEKLEEFARLLLRIAPDLRVRMTPPRFFENKERLAPHQFFCLSLIGTYQPVKMKTLGQRMRVSKQQLTRIIDALVAHEYVTRQPDPTNRRVLLCNLTPKGADLLEAAQILLLEKTKENFASLSEEDIEKLIYHTQEAFSIFSKLPIQEGALHCKE